MSRSCYSDDFGDDFPGQVELFRANVRRSLLSRNGQARLRELRDALLALPVKELEAGIFAEGSNDAPRVCALGAWAVAKANGNVEAAHAMVPRDADDFDTFDKLQKYGWPKLVVLEAIYHNDEGHWRVQTPAQRYDYMLRWVNEQLASPDARDPHQEKEKEKCVAISTKTSTTMKSAGIGMAMRTKRSAPSVVRPAPCRITAASVVRRCATGASRWGAASAKARIDDHRS